MSLPASAYLSSARAFFDDLHGRSDPFGYLSSIPALPDPFFEEEWIDFKGQPQNDNDARSIWSKALSGYANMTDGIVLWGIDARKTAPRDIDAASGLRLISDPLAFESKLRDWIRDATNPPTMGVEYQSYANPANEGFVIAFVPQSAHKPHRAEWANKHYYFRAGDDFLIAEPSMLRLLFYPRYAPNFSIRVSLPWLIDASGNTVLCKTVTNMVITNTGNSSAYDIFIDVIHNGRSVFPALPTPWLINSSNWRAINAGSDGISVMALVPLHPGHSLPFIHSSQCEVRLRNRIPNLAPSGLVPTFPELQCTLDVYARDTTRSRYSVSFTESDVENDNRCTKVCSSLSLPF